MEPLIKSGIQLADEIIEDVDLSGQILTAAKFSDCDFINCRFVETELHSCRFVNCEFKGCDLSLLQIPGCTFSGTSFLKSKLLGINWTVADWSGPRLNDPLLFRSCIINHSVFIGLHLPEIQVIECEAADVDWRESNLEKADFSGTDLTDSQFTNASLKQADFSQARSYTILPDECDITQAKFSLPEALSLLYNLNINLT